jgi:diaminopimelate decarboxylase
MGAGPPIVVDEVLVMTLPWWHHDGFSAHPHGLALDGVALADLAQYAGTPLFVYSRQTVRRQLDHLRATLQDVAAEVQLFYAMKANRHPDLLRFIASLDGVGVDTCSPREIALARACSFAPARISFTASMLSDRDLVAVAHEGVHCTLDSFSALQRYGRLVPPGTGVGLRFDVGVRVGYGQDARLVYGASKFGFALDEAATANTVATRAGLKVDQVHVHLGWGIQAESAPLVEEGFARLAAVARQLPAVRTINVGGGLGGRFRGADSPLPVEQWAAAIRRQLTPLGLGVACEPGTFVAAPAGVLVVEVNTVERRRGVTWVGVDAGFALNPCPALYNIPIEVVPLHAPYAPPTCDYTIVGPINEATDVWVRNYALPQLHEGDLLALLPAGAYAMSMASDHCLRGMAHEVVV